MANPTPQSLANHVRWDTRLFTYGFLFFASAVLGMVAMATGSYWLGLAVALQGVASILLSLNARIYGLVCQDRIIRLEMQLRLARVLPPDLTERIGEFTLPQLIALRFASDAELPALARRVLDEGVTDRKVIKGMIQDWQADHLRV